MGNDKSILERFTDTVKDIANIAADAASHALSAEEPAFKPGERAVAYMPLAADGFVSDPMMAVPIAGARKKKRVAARPAAKKARRKKTARIAVNKSGKRSVKKAAKKPAARKSRKAAKKRAKKARRKTAKAKR